MQMFLYMVKIHNFVFILQNRLYFIFIKGFPLKIVNINKKKKQLVEIDHVPSSYLYSKILILLPSTIQLLKIQN